MMKLKGITGIVLVTVLAGSGIAFAEGSDDTSRNDAAAIQSAKVSVAQAVQSAETKAGGKAVSVDFVSSDDASPYYHVEVVVTDGSEQSLAVDAASGEVMRALGHNDGDGRDGDEGRGGDTDQN